MVAIKYVVNESRETLGETEIYSICILVTMRMSYEYIWSFIRLRIVLMTLNCTDTTHVSVIATSLHMLMILQIDKLYENKSNSN